MLDWRAGDPNVGAVRIEGKGRRRDWEWGCDVEDGNQQNRGNGDGSRCVNHLPTVATHPSVQKIVHGRGRRISRVETPPEVRIRGFGAHRSCLIVEGRCAITREAYISHGFNTFARWEGQ